MSLINCTNCLYFDINRCSNKYATQYNLKVNKDDYCFNHLHKDIIKQLEEYLKGIAT